MDTSDPEIRFDAAGVCNHCLRFDRVVASHVFAGERGRTALEGIVARIREAGKNKPYDCVLGISGGVDSTYTAYHARQLGLRPLAVHLDNGWDTEIAVRNIERALKRLEIDLHTHVIDWDEFRDLQVAFLKASTPDSEIPTDHAIFALLHQTASRMGVRYIITGGNIRTETHFPRAWSQGHGDWKYIREVHRRFGSGSIKTFPFTSWLAMQLDARRHEQVDILNYLDYGRGKAVAVLQRELGWEDYGGKHHESVYTRFFQGYILPRKFRFDKRRAHYSSMLCSGEITREEALRRLEEEPYPLKQQLQDRVYVIKKLGLSEAEFDEIMATPLRSFWDYPSYARMTATAPYAAMRTIYRTVRRRPTPAAV
jgi:N-acetyl sugar amidotransferase